ncbi:MAG: hypothetical protein MJK18_08705 [Bdellovibrionales bacterium]|nr:hypothetical protein [Bdellovibrionales bacterium]
MSRKVIEKDSAETVAINYEPRSIDSQLSEQSLEYVNDKEKRGDFRVDKIVAEYTGIDELEKQSQQREIAQEALKLSQEVQEKAYEEAYQRGLEEGQNKAYEEEKVRIESELQHINQLIEEIRNVKTNLMKENEKQIVNLCFYFAKRLMMKELGENEDYITTVIKKSLEMAQSEEEVTIKMSPEDHKWITEHKETIFKDLNLGEKTVIEEEIDMSRGGVVVETHHGVIDATVEQRLEKLEALLKSQMSG